MSRLKDLAVPTAFRIGMAGTVLSLAIYGIGFPLLNTMELKAYDLYFRSGERLLPGRKRSS